MKKVLLYSGGMDSYIISKLWNPDVKLYIDYGTEQCQEEIKRLPEDVIVKRVDMSEYIESDGKNTIPLRNLLFANIAINYGDIVAIGGVKDDLHYDKTRRFARKATRLFNFVLTKEDSKRKVKVVVPYRGFTKAELLQRYIEHGGDIETLENQSWSCYTPKGNKPCGECNPCKRRNKAIREVQQRNDRKYPIYYCY